MLLPPSDEIIYVKVEVTSGKRYDFAMIDGSISLVEEKEGITAEQNGPFRPYVK